MPFDETLKKYLIGKASALPVPPDPLQNERMYRSSVLGGDRSPITESAFNEEELNALRAAIVSRESKGGNLKAPKGRLGYRDFGLGVGGFGGPAFGEKAWPRKQAWGSTLGNAGYGLNENSELVVNDIYDFSPIDKLGALLYGAGSPKIGAARWLGSQVMPDRGPNKTGRDVKINLGKVGLK